MPFCPKCKAEYREGYNKCKDCNIELVDELVEDIPEEEELYFDSEAVLLKTASNCIEASIIESILDENKIPHCNSNETEAVSSIIGSRLSITIDIYVPESKYELALSLINDVDMENIEFTEEEVLEEFESEYGEEDEEESEEDEEI